MIQKSIFVALLAPALVAFAEQDVINKSFTVKPGGTLLMKVDRGGIRVTTSDTDKVEIQVTRELRRGSPEKAREALAQHMVEFEQDGETVRVESHTAGLNPAKNLFNNLLVQYTVTIPARFNVDLQTAGGNIKVGDLDGTAKTKTSGGGVDLGLITGEIQGLTSGGSIAVKGSKANVRAQTTGGNIRIGDVDGNVVAKTSGGSINVARVKGSLEANTTGGNINVSEAAGPVNAKTSGGSVVAELSNNASGECTLKTTGGNVKLTIPEKIAADLEASTMGGRVTSDFDGDFNKQQTRLVAKLNGGGANMKLSTSGGSVDIRRK